MSGALPKRILIVCHANTGRSVIAEALLRKMLADRGRDDVEVRSGGIAPYARDSSLVSLDARFVIRDFGIEISPETTSCDLKRHPEHFVWAELIVTMTDEQKEMLAAFPDAAGTTAVTLRELAGDSGDIVDPAGRGANFYHARGDEIRDCLERALDRYPG